MTDTEVDDYIRSTQRRARRWAAVGVIALAIVAAIGYAILVAINHNLVTASDERATEALTSSGFRDLELGGPDVAACGKDESSRHFTATNPVGARVTGTVCCGLTGVGKGCTLRWGR